MPAAPGPGLVLRRGGMGAGRGHLLFWMLIWGNEEEKVSSSLQVSFDN